MNGYFSSNVRKYFYCNEQKDRSLNFRIQSQFFNLIMESLHPRSFYEKFCKMSFNEISSLLEKFALFEEYTAAVSSNRRNETN